MNNKKEITEIILQMLCDADFANIDTVLHQEINYEKANEMAKQINKAA